MNPLPVEVDCGIISWEPRNYTVSERTMPSLIRFADTRTQCWSRVDLDNGEPIWISVAQTGVVVKRSRLGLGGAILFKEANVYKIATVARHVGADVDDTLLPHTMTSPVLRAFSHTALTSASAAQLSMRLNGSSVVGGTDFGRDSPDSDKQAEELVHTFAEVLHDRREWILDAAWLPERKDRIYDAFRRLIRHYMQLRAINAERFIEDGYDETLRQIEALQLRVADFQSIDEQDRDIVTRINSGPSIKVLTERLASGAIRASERPQLAEHVQVAMTLAQKYAERTLVEQRERRMKS